MKSRPARWPAGRILLIFARSISVDDNVVVVFCKNNTKCTTTTIKYIVARPRSTTCDDISFFSTQLAAALLLFFRDIDAQHHQVPREHKAAAGGIARIFTAGIISVKMKWPEDFSLKLRQ